MSVSSDRCYFVLCSGDSYPHRSNPPTGTSRPALRDGEQFAPGHLLCPDGTLRL